MPASDGSGVLRRGGRADGYSGSGLGLWGQVTGGKDGQLRFQARMAFFSSECDVPVRVALKLNSRNSFSRVPRLIAARV